MKIGIITTEFAPCKTEALFKKIADIGFSAVQFSYASVAESSYVRDKNIDNT